MPRQDGDLRNSNEDYSVREAASLCICSPNTDSGPGRIHEPVSYHDSPSAASNPSSSSSHRKKSHHQKRKPKRTRSSVSEMSLSLTTLAISSDLVATSSSNSGPSSRQRTFSRTQASSTLTNILNTPSLTPNPPPQFTFVPVESDVTTRRSNVTAAEDLNPFSTSPLPSHLISVMFPSLTSAIDAMLEDKSFKGVQIEIDAMGCAILPPSEYTLSLESECKFHYSFWDSYNQIHFCVPVDLALLLDPSRASLYEHCPLALPPISQVAVRFSTVTFQTRFSRLVPKPTEPVPPSAGTTAQQQQHINTIPIIDPNQPYIITYRGAALKCPNPPYKKSEKDKSEVTIANGIHLSSGWERIVDLDDDLDYQGLRKGRKHGAGEDAKQGKEGQEEKGKRGFSIRAWIPVPASLFLNKETCMFRVDARVGIEDPFSLGNAHDGIRRFGRHGVRWDIGRFDDETRPSNVVCTGRMLEASAEVTVSHLHSEKEMV
ncbi:hypothetical protein M378DRAFT_174643 [Amanita muscaria Koide BX008]|uniref:Uncharacterized protein n=1 Tax=Amanita muscaria (strain Koide BX008) TaxID=946122 RepID=A0A0C2XQ15_AMAMK|nr:hypothetical protein M378DRAFT_174643 [Amanita muscaria Koide BX008]